VASVSVSHLIIFIASLMVAATVAGALVTGVDRISNSVDDRSVDTSRDIRTDVSIISDAGSDAVYNDTSGTVTVLVKNTGTRNLEATTDQVEVLLDGAYVGEHEFTVTSLDGGEFEWRTGSVIRVAIDRSLDGGDHRVQLSVGGDEEVLEFRA